MEIGNLPNPSDPLTFDPPVGCRFLTSKPVKPDQNRSPFKIRQFFHIPASFFSRFWPFFQILTTFSLTSNIFGTINTRSGQTSDFSSRFARNLAKSDGISPDLVWIWQDLTGSGKISPHFEGF